MSSNSHIAQGGTGSEKQTVFCNNRAYIIFTVSRYAWEINRALLIRRLIIIDSYDQRWARSYLFWCKCHFRAVFGQPTAAAATIKLDLSRRRSTIRGHTKRPTNRPTECLSIIRWHQPANQCSHRLNKLSVNTNYDECPLSSTYAADNLRIILEAILLNRMHFDRDWKWSVAAGDSLGKANPSTHACMRHYRLPRCVSSPSPLVVGRTGRIQFFFVHGIKMFFSFIWDLLRVGVELVQ